MLNANSGFLSSQQKKVNFFFFYHSYSISNMAVEIATLYGLMVNLLSADTVLYVIWHNTKAHTHM